MYNIKNWCISTYTNGNSLKNHEKLYDFVLSKILVSKANSLYVIFWNLNLKQTPTFYKSYIFDSQPNKKKFVDEPHKFSLILKKLNSKI